MPTQEERLAAIEQNFTRFQTDAIKSYQDTAMQVTITKGLAETTIGRLATMQWQIDQRFNSLETHLETHQEATNAHFERIEAILAQILKRLPEKP
jgi:ectoine hydroxylase-related dioxygenase (phytanoyl-CoA dioxygenase family)